MTDPTPKARWVDWPTPGLVYGDMRTGEVLAKVKMRAENDAMRTEAYDALVAAVRDADTLREMRQKLEAAYNAWLEAVETDEDDGTVERLFSRLIQQIHPILLPEVIPPVSPDTPTPTGQT